MRRIRRGLPLTLIMVALALGLLVIGFPNSGSFLVVDSREKSDAIVITQGDALDAPYGMGLRLLAEGYGRELLIDARVDRIFFGRSQTDWTADFIRKTAGGLADRVKVCPITADTTAQEVYETANCLKARGVHSVLLIVDDFHTRRSLEIFSRLLPGYHFSTAPISNDKTFGVQWWRKRQWVRTAVVEWQHLLWWELVDRWRFAPLTLGPETHSAETN